MFAWERWPILFRGTHRPVYRLAREGIASLLQRGGTLAHATYSAHQQDIRSLPKETGMAKSGKTSPRVAKKAAKELRTGTGSKKNVRSVAGSDLRQAGRKSGKKK